MHVSFSLVLSRIVSAAIWWISFYLALPRVQLNISFLAAFLMATIIAVAIMFFDQTIFLYRSQPKRVGELKVFLTLRVFASIVMAWIGGYAITLRLFWDTYKLYRPSPQSRRHLETFFNMSNRESNVLWVLIAMVLVLFLFDNLGRLVSALVSKEQVTVEQEETIQAQDAYIQKQESDIQEKDKEISEAHRQQLNLIASVQHELGGKLPVVKNTLADLRVALHSLGSRVPGFSLEQKIRQRLPGESPDGVDSFSDLLARMESALHFSIATVNNIRGIIHADPSRFRPEPLPLLSWLKMELPDFIPQTGGIEIAYEGDNPTVLIDRKQMSIVLHNLVENACRHAFADHPAPHKLLLVVKDEPTGCWWEFHNNGRSLPAGFNELGFFQAGKYYGDRGHSGLGGYLVGMVAASHNATAHVGNSSRPGYTTAFRILFPHPLPT